MKKLIISTIEASTNNVLFSIKTQKFSTKYIVTVGVLMWNNVVCYSKMGVINDEDFTPKKSHSDVTIMVTSSIFDKLSPLPLEERLKPFEEKTERTDSKIKLVVGDEHTLGYIQPNSQFVSVLHSSILKGSPFGLNPSNLLTSQFKSIRLATPQDFEEFKICFKGFENKTQYVYN